MTMPIDVGNQQVDAVVDVRPPTADERLAALLAALADAQTLGDVREAAQAAGGAA